ncbi:uncharacterized protein DUF2868 [Chthoniobacter flavus]|uniref:DUF2868 domain-containing protein n=1 Tax=Chthoniobacter flavus TaxID=191863 RepID=UPI00104A21A2|nr:DUF2868 domain-containing protein [Chthoniobacter flavus]TCO91808.1 uncharacterized protein DUF2868 [Chthoniobacter flavus]
MPRSEKWTLADRLDFEALVAADERATDLAAIAARDARLWEEKIAPSLNAEERSNRATVFHRWLEARRPGEILPGKWFTSTSRWFNASAILAGLVLGFAVASGALYYAGERPVNIAVFLAVTVGVQWILLLWTLVVMLSSGIRATSQHLLARLGEGIGQALASVADHLSGERRMRLRAELATLRQLSGRNLQPLVWTPLLALQSFGVFWNAGVLLALLARVLFTDVAFGWESTVANSPNGMYALVKALATPWLLFGLNFCPSLEQVEHSWFHYQSGMAALDRGATVSWWPWLILFVFVYGMIPRSLLRTYFRTRMRLAMRQLSFDEPRHRAAWHRLTGPVIHSNRPVSEATPSSQHGFTATSVTRAQIGCLLVDTSLVSAKGEIEQWVAKQLGWKLACSEVVEVDYPSGNDAALARVAATLPAAPCWLIAVPAPFTAFSAFTQFAARVGALTNETTKSEGFVVVVALDAQGKPKAPDPEWMRYWSDFLRAEETGCVTFSYAP